MWLGTTESPQALKQAQMDPGTCFHHLSFIIEAPWPPSRPVIRTNQPFVLRGCLCCNWSIYSAQGLWCCPVAISKSQGPTAHLVAKEPEEGRSPRPTNTLHSLDHFPDLDSKNWATGKIWVSEMKCPTAWLSLGQRKDVWLEGMASKVIHFFKKGKQRLIEVKWFAQVHTTDL